VDAEGSRQVLLSEIIDHRKEWKLQMMMSHVEERQAFENNDDKRLEDVCAMERWF
jgi:hypothetical protein